MSLGKILDPHRVYTVANSNAFFVKKTLHFLNNSIQFVTSPYFFFSSCKVRLYEGVTDQYVRVDSRSSLKGRFFHLVILSTLVAAGWKYRSQYRQQMPYILAGVLVMKICSNLLIQKDIKMENVSKLAETHEEKGNLDKAQILFKFVFDCDKEEQGKLGALNGLSNLFNIYYRGNGIDKDLDMSKRLYQEIKEHYKSFVEKCEGENKTKALEGLVFLIGCYCPDYFAAITDVKMTNEELLETEELCKYIAERSEGDNKSKVLNKLVEIGEYYIPIYVSNLDRKSGYVSGVDGKSEFEVCIKAESLFQYVIEHGDKRIKLTALSKLVRLVGMYHHGTTGVGKDLDEANALYEKIVKEYKNIIEIGDEDSEWSAFQGLADLGESCIPSGYGEKIDVKDLSKAESLFKYIFENGDELQKSSALSKLVRVGAGFIRGGYGEKIDVKDLSKAKSLFNYVFERGDELKKSSALLILVRLIRIYHRGEQGVEKDLDEANRLYKEVKDKSQDIIDCADEKAKLEALSILVRLGEYYAPYRWYDSEKKDPEDVSKAKELFQLAASHGSEKARENLRALENEK